MTGFEAIWKGGEENTITAETTDGTIDVGGDLRGGHEHAPS